MSGAVHKTLVLACGALAKEIIALKKAMSLADGVFDLQCLPAGYHNHPEKIVPALRNVLEAEGREYDNILIGYGDCGTGGGLDRLLEDYPHAKRLPGAHCYAFYASINKFDAMMEEELGTFFLTDYLVRHFKTLIIKGMGLDIHPNLIATYFEHYKKMVYMSQAPTDDLISQGQEAAEFLGLAFEHRHVGYGELESYIARLPEKERAYG